MNEVWLVHTINDDLSENELRVFIQKSLAQVFAWNYYMQNCFCEEDAQEDWMSLILDNEIYCETSSGQRIKSIWITYHKVVESIEPKITFTVDLNNNRKSKS